MLASTVSVLKVSTGSQVLTYWKTTGPKKVANNGKSVSYIYMPSIGGILATKNYGLQMNFVQMSSIYMVEYWPQMNCEKLLTNLKKII